MKKLLFVMAVPLLFTACEPEGESRQISTVETIVSNVVMPDTISLGDTLKIQMDYKIYNDCGVYVGTEASRSANSVLLRPFVTYSYEGSTPCPENVTIGEEIVRFKPEAKGKYLFFFRKDNNGYKADTLVVK